MMKKGLVRFSIKTRLILIFSLVICILVLGTSIFFYFNAKLIIESDIAREAQLIAENNARAISEWFKGIEDEMYFFSIIPTVRNLELDEARSIMNSLIKERPEYGGILVADLTGLATTVEGLTIDISKRDYFIEALATGKTFYSDPMITQGTNMATIMLARPIYGASSMSPVGVVAFSVTLEHMQGIAESMNLAGYGYGWLINDSGIVVGHPNLDYIGNSRYLTEEPTLKPVVDQMLVGKAGVGSYKLKNADRLIAYAPITQNGWSIAVEAYQEDVLQAVSRMRTIINYMIGVALIVGFVIALALANSLSNPILQLTKSAEKVSHGDLTEVIEVKRQDEIGVLASAFSKMITNLSNIIESVKVSADQVSDTSSQLAAATAQTGASIEEVANSTNIFSQTVTSMTGSVGEVSESARNITVMASDGEAALDKTFQQMEELRDSIRSLSGIIASLESSSTEIEKIVQAISAIAEQTNLLSLNAAIEAARAGEHGQGFAVVADEVRKLSDESSAATNTIRELISDIQQKTRQAVEGMQKSELNVEETSHVVGDTGRLLTTIINGINEIGERINAIGQDTKKIDVGAQEMAAATEEQSATIEEISSSVQELSSMAEHLQRLIEQFKV